MARAPGHRIGALSLLLAALAFAAPAAAKDAWRNLVTDDASFAGWEKLGGPGTFAVEDGVVVGTAVAGGPNAFLSTTESFGDFILEFEVKTDPELNSGVMIRGQSDLAYRDGVVHGYQVEVDPSDRAWSGGIYDEQRRGWLQSLAREPEAQAAFKSGAWNAYRVEAIGPRLKVWVNGVQTANVVDDMDASGFIALQVHGVSPGFGRDGAEVRFRNVRILTEGVAKAAKPVDAGARIYNYIPNSLTDEERAQGWRLLWDGETTDGWRGARLDGFPEQGWTIADGVLSVEKSAGGEAVNGGDIITTEKFSSFELSVDFRLTEGANSGIKYFVDPELLKGPGSAIGLEYQILDDARHPDAKMGVAGNRTLASLYDLIPATNLSEAGRDDKRANPIGDWNRALLVVDGSHVEHWLNGVKVVEYQRGTQIYRALVAYSKYKVWPNFGELPQGPLLLQDHGDAVSFRSIKIRELTE